MNQPSINPKYHGVVKRKSIWSIFDSKYNISIKSVELNENFESIISKPNFQDSTS